MVPTLNPGWRGWVGEGDLARDVKGLIGMGDECMIRDKVYEVLEEE